MKKKMPMKMPKVKKMTHSEEEMGGMMKKMKMPKGKKRSGK